MSVFRNLRIYPDHGARSATITWEFAAGTELGDVYVAFSDVGTDGSWHALNPDAPVASEVGMYQDDTLLLNKGTADGFYRLLLVGDSATEYFSEPIQILGDLTPREYGIVRSMIHQEYTQMRVTNGFPVWHCIPRTIGDPADTVDPDDQLRRGLECDQNDDDVNSFGEDVQGGFYPPVLTWMRIVDHAEGLKDDPDKFSPEDMTKTAARLMAFPRPGRGHMLVDPTTDMRYLVGDEIKPYRLRGVIAVAYEVTLHFLKQNDERYKFPTPAIDTKAYRRIPYWTTVQP